MKYIIIDVQTAKCCRKYEELSLEKQKTFANRFPDDVESNFEKESVNLDAYNKIICITCKVIEHHYELNTFDDVVLKNKNSNEISTFILRGDEETILTNFCALMNRVSGNSNITFCGYGIKQFAIPMLFRKLYALILKSNCEFKIPNVLKPFVDYRTKVYDIKILDLYNVFSFSGYHTRLKLDELCVLLGIEPIEKYYTNQQVSDLFYENKDDVIYNYSIELVEKMLKITKAYLSSLF